MPEIAPVNVHRPVLLAETVGLLPRNGDALFIDATVGLGGHSEGILEASTKSRLIAIDQDGEALELAKRRLERFGSRVTFRHANFSEVQRIVSEWGNEMPTGIIADLGVSSLQLDSESRGFSFRFDAPLDMRMDPRSGEPTAAELLKTLDREEIANLIYRFGEERHSRRIARRIIERRESGQPVETTFELADLVRRCVPPRPKDKIHPATRTFQALRIAVNHELEIIERFIDDSVDLLKTEGVLAIITFHSLEDRIVKQAFQRLSGKCSCPPRMPVCICGAVKKVEVLTRKPIIASQMEQNENPRSRSANLRACRKLD